MSDAAGCASFRNASNVPEGWGGVIFLEEKKFIYFGDFYADFAPILLTYICRRVR